MTTILKYAAAIGMQKNEEENHLPISFYCCCCLKRI